MESLWVFDPQPSVDWPVQGQAWLNAVWKGVAVAQGVAPARNTAIGWSGGFSHSAPGIRTRCKLVTIALEDPGQLVALLYQDKATLDEELPMWQGAIVEAQEALNRREKFTWWTAITATTFGPNPGLCDFEGMVDGIRMKRPNGQYVRFAPNSTVMGGGTVEARVPVVVIGQTEAYDYFQATAEAQTALAWLCAELSLDSEAVHGGGGAWWSVLQRPPQPWVEGQAAPQLPTHQTECLRLLGDQVEVWATSEVLLTGRADSIADLRRRDFAFAELLQGYYHARTIEETSPSLAAVLYTSIVETIGLRSNPLRNCSCCSSCPYKIGYANAFRSALRHALPTTDADVLKDLTKELYPKRSRTAHAAVLHGAEFSDGFSFGGGLFDRVSKQQHYRYQEVWPLRDAATTLLRNWADGTLPRLDANNPVGHQ